MNSRIWLPLSALCGSSVTAIAAWAYHHGRWHQHDELIDLLRQSVASQTDGVAKAEVLPPSTLNAAIKRTSVADKKQCPKWDKNWDFRENQSLSKDQGLRFGRSRVVILVRHGQYNTFGQSDDGHSLTDLGIQQAELTGQRISEYINLYMKNVKQRLSDDLRDVHFPVRVITSTMLRAKQTGRIIFDTLNETEDSDKNWHTSKKLSACSLICEGPPVEPDPPIDPSVYDPEPWEYEAEGARIEAGFRKHVHRLGATDVKTYLPLLERVSDDHDASSMVCPVDVIVCHGNVIRYFVSRALQQNPRMWLRLSICHASVTVLRIRTNSGHVSVDKYGEIGHLPVDCVTFS